MLYLLIRSVTATPCKYYMTSNTTESADKFLSFIIISQFISKVKVCKIFS